MFDAKVASLTGRRIFLVEDDVVNLTVVTRVLERSDARIFENYSSIGIVPHVIQNLPIDLILLDIMLRRGISGYDVIDQLKDHPATARIPVVAVSSLDPETEIPRAKAKGFDGFCPLGPWVATDVDPGDLLIECWVADYRQKSPVLDELNLSIKDRFEAAGISFPQRELVVRLVDNR